MPTIKSQNLEVYRYIQSSIIRNWKQILNELKHIRAESSDDFSVIHVITIPQSNYYFDGANPKPKYWTFAFIMARLYPDCLFWIWSDHNDGVFEIKGKNHYVIASENLLFRFDNKSSTKVLPTKCETIDIVNPKYICLDWDTGDAICSEDISYYSNFIQNHTHGARQLYDRNFQHFKSLEIVDPIILNVREVGFIDYLNPDPSVPSITILSRGKMLYHILHSNYSKWVRTMIKVYSINTEILPCFIEFSHKEGKYHAKRVGKS